MLRYPIFLTLVLVATASAAQELKTAIVEGGSVVTDLGYGIQVHQNAFARVDLIKRDWKDFYAAKLLLSNPRATDPFGQKSDVRFLINDDQTKRTYRALQSQASWRPTSHSSLGLTYTYSRLRGNDEGESAGSATVPNNPLSLFYPQYLGYAARLPEGVLPEDTPHIETVLERSEVISAVTVPANSAARRSHYLKVRDRASFEFALVSAAVALDMEGPRIRQARIALGGVGTKLWRVLRVEAALAGASLDPATLRGAAALAADGAQGRGHNDFKIELMQRAIVRAVEIAGARA